jgi:hypothetical protein
MCGMLEDKVERDDGSYESEGGGDDEAQLVKCESSLPKIDLLDYCWLALVSFIFPKVARAMRLDRGGSRTLFILVCGITHRPPHG